MSSLLNMATVLAAVFATMASAAPAPVAAVRIGSSKITAATPKTILMPVPKKQWAGAQLTKRQSVPITAVDALTPNENITLLYQSADVDAMRAEVDATMNHPAILLEDVDSISKVDCSAESVAVTFSEVSEYEEIFTAWPQDSFILLTNHLGDCDTDNERGLYVVNSLGFDNKTLTVTASTIRSDFNSSAGEMTISFGKQAANPVKREVTQTFLGDFPGTLTLSDDPVSKSLSVKVHEPSLSGNLDVSGHFHYSFHRFRVTEFWFDVDLSIAMGANVEVIANLGFDNDVYSFTPASVTVAAFSIPGILDVGPALSFDLGVEVAVSGTVDITSNLTATLNEGHIHLDMLDAKNTFSSGWQPVYTHQTNVSATVEAQVNPFVSLTAEIAANFLNGLLDLSSGITARPEFVNVFTIDGQFDTANSANVTFPAPTEEKCVNGMWYSNAFAFIVTAFVTQFYELELYRLDVPLYESGCWSWVPEAMATNSSVTLPAA
ncbi:hypothetical protein PVAG01_01669 [Phlyctema vagabunda]|uniref:Isoamyl alcohol n=1 Tax=Phlyctema vagabunda TaxID=108571 RepID=A0ABR4PXR5_9HELO